VATLRRRSGSDRFRRGIGPELAAAQARAYDSNSTRPRSAGVFLGTPPATVRGLRFQAERPQRRRAPAAGPRRRLGAQASRIAAAQAAREVGGEGDRPHGRRQLPVVDPPGRASARSAEARHRVWFGPISQNTWWSRVAWSENQQLWSVRRLLLAAGQGGGVVLPGAGGQWLDRGDQQLPPGRDTPCLEAAGKDSPDPRA